MSTLYQVGYAVYRTVAVVVLVAMMGQSVIDWQLEGPNIPLLLLRVLVAFAWSAMLWGAPDMLSGRWGKSLRSQAVGPRPSLLWIPLIGFLGIVGTPLMGVMLIYSVLIINKAWAPAALVISCFGALLIMIPLLVGSTRLFLRMRRVESQKI